MVILYVTPFGIGASPDSVVYMVGARSLAAGAGFSLPTVDGQFRLNTTMPRSPPHVVCWRAVRIGIIIVGANFERSALCREFIADVSNQSRICRKGKSQLRSGFPAHCGSCFSPFFVLQIHAMAWSEPLFIFIFLISLKFAGDYLEKPSYIKLIAAGLAAGAAL